jgi:hypothetical protein
MGSGADLRSRLVSVTAPLGVLTKSDDNATAKLERLLVRSRVDDAAALTPRELSIERATWYGPEALSPERMQRILTAELSRVKVLLHSQHGSETGTACRIEQESRRFQPGIPQRAAPMARRNASCWVTIPREHRTAATA